MLVAKNRLNSACDRGGRAERGRSDADTSLRDRTGNLLQLGFGQTSEALPEPIAELLARLGSEMDDEAKEEADRQFKGMIMMILPHLRSYARQICKSDDLANDLVQETLMRAWSARSRFELGTNGRAWLFRILQNNWITYVRKARRVGDWYDGLADRLQTSGGQEQALHFQDVQQGLDQLPEAQRSALLLIGAHGMSYEEAAEICAVPIGTVKSRVARARDSLTRYFGGASAT